MTEPIFNAVPQGRVVQDLTEPAIKSSTDASSGSGTDALLRLASVQRLDPKRMTVDLITLTGAMTPYKNVPLTFGSAGARSFCGVLPDLNDNCIIGFAPKESGRTKSPYIVGWIVLFKRRRHKLHNFAPGNACVSSSQGADLILDESATLVNRRGNEVILRDQDQALIVRTLQQYHAGAGFRIYGGMVQREACLLPTQMFSDGRNWASMGQTDEEGAPVGYMDFESDAASPKGWLTPEAVFARDGESGDALGPENIDGGLDPFDLLQRGLFVDQHGGRYDSKSAPNAVYGGKPLYRISQDIAAGGSVAFNSMLGDVPTFTEYRIEVAHTSDGTLPVTEQTDGIDVDRMPPAPPTSGNALNTSTNVPFVELVMGTVVGNDPIGARAQYGMPLKAEIYKDGAFAPKVTKVASALGSDLTDQLAFMIRVRNPDDPSATPAFWGITKGGALKSYFPGKGSETAQEHYQTGKKIHLGAGPENQSFAIEAEGAISFRNEGLTPPTSGIGFSAEAVNGGLKLYGGAAINESGNSAPPADPDAAVAASGEPQASVLIKGAVDGLLEFPNGKCFLRSPEIIMDNASTIRQVSSGGHYVDCDTSTKTTGRESKTVTEGANHTYGGPGKPSKGALLEVAITGTPATGCLGGAVSKTGIKYGGLEEKLLLGRRSTLAKIGGIGMECMSPGSLVEIGPGASCEMQTGPPRTNNGISVGLLGGTMESAIPLAGVTMKATAGSASIVGGMGVAVKGARITMKAAYTSIAAPPFGGVVSDTCIDPLTGTPLIAAGLIGCPTFRTAP
jgi:hypothetical protein